MYFVASLYFRHLPLMLPQGETSWHETGCWSFEEISFPFVLARSDLSKHALEVSFKFFFLAFGTVPVLPAMQKRNGSLDAI